MTTQVHTSEPNTGAHDEDVERAFRVSADARVPTVRTSAANIAMREDLMPISKLSRHIA
jgi:hypothetical protein